MVKLNNISNSAKIILFFSALCFLTGLYLFIYESRHRDYQYQKNWSAAYFLNPEENNLSFAIENYENEDLIYSYQLINEKGDVFKKGKLEIKPTQKKGITTKDSCDKGGVVIEYKNKKITLKK